MSQHLMGVREIADLLGVSRQRVDEITRTDDRFPAPVAELASGRIWKRAEVERWATKNGRTPGVPKGPRGRSG